MEGKNSERTFLMIKPDGVQRRLVGKIVQRFEERGYKLVAMKTVKPSKEHFENHYSDLKSKPFFPGLLSYMMMGPVVAMCWEGLDIVRQARRMLGETKPLESNAGTIRGDYSIDIGRNIMHGSDAVDSAKKELALWFTPEELIDYQNVDSKLVYE